MLNKIKEMWNRWSTEGMRFPFVYDPVEQKPSITIFYPYVTFILAVISLIALHFFPAILTATLVAIGFWVIAVVLYMIRKISKAKFSLESKSVELESEPETKTASN